MTQEEVVAQVIDALHRVGIVYMVAGSFASNFHGVPRMTRMRISWWTHGRRSPGDGVRSVSATERSSCRSCDRYRRGTADLAPGCVTPARSIVAAP